MNSFLEKLKKRSKTDYLIIILIGVLVMIVAVPTGDKTEKKDKTEQTQQETEEKKQTDDTEELEAQLEALISRMEGAGKTQVMITLEDDGFLQVDKNISTDEQKREETTVVYDTGEGDQPYVIRKERPKVKGVVVVAEGGDDPKVVSAISDAVMSLFDIEAHRVIVVKMSVQEE